MLKTSHLLYTNQSPIYNTENFWHGSDKSGTRTFILPCQSNFGTAKSNLGTSCGLSFLVSKLKTTAVCMRRPSGAFHSNMTEEQYLEYLLIKKPPATCIANILRNARRIFTSDFRRMREKKDGTGFFSSCSNSRLQCGSILLDDGAK